MIILYLLFVLVCAFSVVMVFGMIFMHSATHNGYWKSSYCKQYISNSRWGSCPQVGSHSYQSWPKAVWIYLRSDLYISSDPILWLMTEERKLISVSPLPYFWALNIGFFIFVSNCRKWSAKWKEHHCFQTPCSLRTRFIT